MHPVFRKQFNAAFTPEKYQALLQTMNTEFGEPVTFRVAEAPVFVPKFLKDKILRAVDDIVAVLTRPDFRTLSKDAIPKHLWVPNEAVHPKFLQFDFGICRDADGSLTPQLIELQGFPSLYFYQHLLAQGYRRHFDLPEDFHHLFGGIDSEQYLDLLRQVIIADAKPENVILLEVEPEKQNTRIDFWGTRKYLGLKVLCLSKVKRSGRELYYIDDEGRKVPIQRMYNRVIFDELEKRADLPREWDMFEEVDAEWVGHPNWFFRISKHTLPLLKSEFVPETHFLSELKSPPADLENWVLKPLYSFSGQGVKVNVTREDLETIEEPSNFILQRKVEYISGIETVIPNEPAKCEIRMMMLWEPDWEKPVLVNNLIRISKGEMVGVRYNMGKEWVGSSVGFFEP
ncbi:MAG: hypothetical protein H6574_25030 [Lewinellaceae bacterium]|nr:hypothetical protein [Saprospiraceae bacterium]MCB9334325.1 hypothetical protein [Lewinellaceae bacterium]